MRQTTATAWRPGAALRAWQDTARALSESYTDNVKRTVTLVADPARGLQQAEALREDVERIVASGGELLRAQTAVAGEWLRAPFWVTGAASPSDLQTRYFTLFDARRSYYRALFDATIRWQRALSEAGETVLGTAREGLDSQVQTSRRVANDQRQIQQEVVDTARAATAATTDVADRIAEQAREAVEAAQETLAQSSAVVAANAPVAPASPPALTIKATITGAGDKLYYLPGQPEYDAISPDVSFASPEDAQAAGFLPLLSPDSAPIRGNVNSKGEKIYHMPGQANYDRVEAVETFATEDAARAAGYRPAQR